MTASARSFWSADAPLVLASGSSARAALLQAAGLPFEVVASRLDERVAEADLPKSAGPSMVAVALALAKALDVSRDQPGRLVLGADQTLVADQERFFKPADRTAAAAQLRALRGRTHRLVSGAALVRDGAPLWTDAGEAELAMRPVSDSFIELYLDAAGDAVLSSVGAYQIEGLGVHLFERIAGDHATILGLPLLGVLQALRTCGALAG